MHHIILWAGAPPHATFTMFIILIVILLYYYYYYYYGESTFYLFEFIAWAIKGTETLIYAFSPSWHDYCYSQVTGLKNKTQTSADKKNLGSSAVNQTQEKMAWVQLSPLYSAFLQNLKQSLMVIESKF